MATASNEVTGRDIHDMLANRVDSLCTALLSNGKKQSGSWRVGGTDNSKGDKLSVKLGGTATGQWQDFSTGEGGNLLNLIAAVHGFSMPDAVAWAKVWLGLADGQAKAPEPRGAPDPAKAAQELRAARVKPRAMWRRGMAIEESAIGWRYIRQVRGYGGVIPATLRFLEASERYPAPCIMAAFGITSEPEPGELAIADDDVMGVHLIKLKPDGSGKADVDPNKITVGQGSMGFPIVVAPPNDLLGLCICEGVEDALSYHEANGVGAWAAGGAGRMPALADAVPEYIDFVTVCFDVDEKRAGQKGAEETIARLRKRGFECEAIEWRSKP
jgi:Toprim domain